MKKLMYSGVISLLLIFGLSSCWPSSVSFNDGGSMPPEWKFFSVKNIENSASNSPLSYALLLTDDLKTGIQNNTKLQLASGLNKPQISIEGKVVSYMVSPVALQVGDNAAQNRLTISASFEIFISEPKEEKYFLNVARFADYSSSQDLTTVETQLIEVINKQIMQDVVNKLLSNW
jgi:hypothetical protein